MDSMILVGLVAGALTSSSSIPQAVKIIRSRSAKDVSTLFFVLMAVGVALWLFYGLYLANLALVLWNAVSLVFYLAILALKHIYG
jgi:MtN3 and saliva related transmembrane protein